MAKLKCWLCGITIGKVAQLGYLRCGKKGERSFAECRRCHNKKESMLLKDIKKQKWATGLMVSDNALKKMRRAKAVPYGFLS